MSKQGDLFDVFGTEPRKLYRPEDPSTSRDAAHQVDTTSLEREVLVVIAASGSVGVISDEVRDRFPAGTSYSSVTARYKALKEKGLIELVGKRPGRSGRQQSVMVVTALGGLVLKEEKDEPERVQRLIKDRE